MQLWDAREELERFNAEVFLPAMVRLGPRGFPHPPQVRDVNTVKSWIGSEELP